MRPGSGEISWRDFVHAREERRQASLHAAERSLLGDHGPATMLLGAWSWAGQTTWMEGLLAALEEAPPSPAPAALTAVLAPRDELPPGPSGDTTPTPHHFRMHLEHACTTMMDPDRRLVLAWGLAELSFLAEQVEQRLRAPWLAETFAADRQLDLATREIWKQWLAGEAFASREAWKDLFGEDARGAISRVLASKQRPRSARQVLERLDECLDYIGADMRKPAPWRELAGHLLETGPAEPLDELAAALSDEEWDRVSPCAVQRGYGPATARMAFPACGSASARARALRDVARPTADGLRRYVELHQCRSSVRRWRDPGATTWEVTWRSVLQVHGRARSRLRAVLANASADTLAPAILGMDSLHARTRRAVSRYFRDWAFEELKRDFQFSIEEPVYPPCNTSPESAPPFDTGERRLLSTWVLKAILKGHLSRLERWVATGSTGDRDTQWGELLSSDLPDRACKGGEGSAPRSYERVRDHLSESLPDTLDELMPVVTNVAELDTRRRDLGPAFRALVEPTWSSEIPPLRIRFKRYVLQAREAAAAILDRRA